MRNILAIAHREFVSYFTSPLAYLAVPVFLGLVGFFSLYFQDLFASGIASLKSMFFWAAILAQSSLVLDPKSASIELLIWEST